MEVTDTEEMTDPTLVVPAPFDTMPMAGSAPEQAGLIRKRSTPIQGISPESLAAISDQQRFRIETVRQEDHPGMDRLLQTGFRDARLVPEVATNSIEGRIQRRVILTEAGVNHFPVREIVEIQ